MMKKQKIMLYRIIAAAVIYVPLFVLEHMGKLEFQSEIPVQFLLFMIPYLIVGWDIIYRAVRNISHGQVFDENFLMCIATFGALGVKEYSEAVAVMLFYQGVIPELCSQPFPPVNQCNDGYLSGICEY